MSELTDDQLLELAAEFLAERELIYGAFVHWSEDGDEPAGVEDLPDVFGVLQGRYPQFLPTACCTAGAVIAACARNGASVEKTVELLDEVGEMVAPASEHGRENRPRNWVYRWNDADGPYGSTERPTKAEALALLRRTAARLRGRP